MMPPQLLYIDSIIIVLLQELGADPVGDITNFIAEPGFGMKCTIKGIEAFTKQITGRRNGNSALISRYALHIQWHLIASSPASLSNYYELLIGFKYQ